MLARGFKSWWNTRLRRKGQVATFISVFVIVFLMTGLRVSLLVGVAIAAAIGLVLHPVFKRRGWSYEKQA